MELLMSMDEEFTSKSDDFQGYLMNKLVLLLKWTGIGVCFHWIAIPIAIYYGKMSLWFRFSCPMIFWVLFLCLLLFNPKTCDWFVVLSVKLMRFSFKLHPFRLPTTMVDIHPLISADVRHFKNPLNVMAHYLYIATCLIDQANLLSRLVCSKDLYETLDVLFPDDIQSQILQYLFGDKVCIRRIREKQKNLL